VDGTLNSSLVSISRLKDALLGRQGRRVREERKSAPVNPACRVPEAGRTFL
jgi:hypothetical protein